MKMKKLKMGIVAATVGAATLLTSTAAMAVDDQFIGNLVYRTGPYAPGGIPVADGFADYINLLNARDGGINGVKLDLEECDFAYNTDKGVECYERLKNKGATGMPGVLPLSTGVTYALLVLAESDENPRDLPCYARPHSSDVSIYLSVLPPAAM